MSGMRVGGLASGMDIDSLVEKLMSAEKAPLNKLYQQKQTYEWQRDAYREVNKSLEAFDKFLFDEMTLQKDFFTKTVTTNNQAVTATATSSASGSLHIDEVEQLATSGRGLGVISDPLKRYKKTSLADLGIQGNDKGEIKVTLMVAKPKSEQVTNPDPNDVTFDYSKNFTKVEKTIKVSDSIENVVASLNKETGLNTFYDEATGQFSLVASKTGEGATYAQPVEGGSPALQANTNVYVDSGKELFTALGFGGSGVLASGGQDAKLKVNGAEITRSSNTFEINGYTLTLNDEYKATAGTKPITLTSTTDTDKMVDKVKKFVETYNGLVESLNSLSKETKYRDFAPLTDEQKSEMEDKEIEKWEKKAKSGILRNDPILRSALDKMRGILYEKGGSSNPLIDTFHEMGITTTKNFSDGGKLEINETKLREKIEQDPEAVFKTFSNSTEGGLGIVNKLRTSVSETKQRIEERAGKTSATEQTYTIGKNLLNVEGRITSWLRKLENIENRYWSQFTAMEKAINKANTQSSMLFAGQSTQ